MIRKINKNYLCAVIYGIFGSLGAACLFNWYAMAAFGERHLHPYSYPFSICAGILSFFVCVAVAMLNMRFLSVDEKKLKTVLIEFAVTVFGFVFFIFAWGAAWELVSRMISKG